MGSERERWNGIMFGESTGNVFACEGKKWGVQAGLDGWKGLEASDEEELGCREVKVGVEPHDEGVVPPDQQQK